MWGKCIPDQGINAKGQRQDAVFKKQEEANVMETNEQGE